MLMMANTKNSRLYHFAASQWYGGQFSPCPVWVPLQHNWNLFDLAHRLCPKIRWMENGSTSLSENQTFSWRAAMHGFSKCPGVRRGNRTAGWLIKSAESYEAQMHGSHREQRPRSASPVLWIPPTA